MTSSEIIHNFTHQVKDKERAGDYFYEGLTLYRKGWYNNRILAKIIDVKKKIVLIDNTFNMKGCFGNGQSAQTISRAFDSSTWTKLNYEKLNTLPDILTKDDWLKVILYHIKLSLENVFDRYIHEKELIINNKCFKSHYYEYIKLSEVQDLIVNLCKKLKVKKLLVLNHIYNTNRSCIIRQRGWGSRNADWSTIKLDKPIKWYLNPDKWWKPKELAILEFKKWKANYVDSGSGTELEGRTYKEIYDNPQLKEQFEQHMELILKLREETRIRNEEARKKKALEDNKERVEKWLNGEYAGNLWNIPIHLRLTKFYEFTDYNPVKQEVKAAPQVETSLGVKVPLKHAELLFKKFKQCIDTDTEWQANGHSIPIGNFKVEWIRKIDGRWALKSGCHTIFKEQIYDFVERNKLNWYGEN